VENEGHGVPGAAESVAPDAAVTPLDLHTAERLLLERARQIAELEGVRDRLVAREARLATVEAELTALQRAREAEVRHLQARIEQLEQLYPGLLERDERIASLEEQLDAAAEEAVLRAATRAAPAAGPAERTASDVSGAGHYADWEQWFRDRLDERSDARLARLEATARHQHEVLVEKETLIADLLARLSAEPEQAPDDLKRIKGIGPAIEKLLHELGISSMQQIADLTEMEAELISGQLQAFGDRIWRDGWIEQARLLTRSAPAGE